MRNIDCSVIIPSYNAEKTIIRCLKSFELTREHKHNIEIIVVDDGSTDKTLELTQNYLNKFNNCRIITKLNGGVSSARNLGIRESKGDYIYFCDADDEINRATFEMLLCLAKERDLDVIIASYCYANRDIDKPVRENIPSDILLTSEYIVNNIMKSYASGSGPASVWNKIYKKSIIDNYNLLFDENSHLGEDWAFNMDFFSVAKNAYSVADILYFYYTDGSTGTLSKYNRNLENTLISGYKRIINTNEKYHFFNEDSTELKKVSKSFICQVIDFLELDGISAKRKMLLLNNEHVKYALKILKTLKHNEIPKWTRKNHFAIVLLQLKLYKVLIWLHYLLRIDIIPN